MSSRQGSARRAARKWKARNTDVGSMPSSTHQGESRHQGTPHSNSTLRAGQSPSGRKLPEISWTEAATSQSHSTDMVLYKTPAFHTIAKDGMIPFPFEVHPHLQVTGILSLSCRSINATYKSQAVILSPSCRSTNLYFTIALSQDNTPQGRFCNFAKQPRRKPSRAAWESPNYMITSVTPSQSSQKGQAAHKEHGH